MARLPAYLSVTALALWQGVAAQNHVSDKTALFDGLDFNEDGLLAALPAQTPTSVRKWTGDIIPNGCKIFAEGHCSPFDMEIYDVQYADCNGNPWTFCRCSNSTWTVDDMTETLGRLPIKARQYTRIYTSFALSGNGPVGNAYTAGVDTILFDNTDKSIKNPTVAIHENGHSIDGYWNARNGGSGRISASTDFVNAIEADTCVPDNYAKSNDVEDFAQVVVLGSYDKNTGGLNQYADPSCLANQLSYVEGKIGATLTQGGTCDFTWARDTIVCKGADGSCTLPAPTAVPRKRELEVPVVEAPEVDRRAIAMDHGHKMLPRSVRKARGKMMKKGGSMN